MISGGAGAVGHYAMQMAKREGARLVLAKVSGEEKAAPARATGADLAFNYKSEDWADRAQAIGALTELLATNRLEHNIAARLPLARIAEAHELVEQGGAAGKVLLEIG